MFAIDSAMAQHWWVKPFLRFTRAMPLDPTKPMATRTLINAVKSGEPLIIFPEGRLTVTGSLMKIYDGAGLIADKTDAFVVPVRLEGLDATPFTRLHRSQIRRRWFPKVTVTVLEPVKLTVDPALKGKHRRMAAGAALYEIMSNLVYRTTSIERTVPEALIEAAEVHGMGRVAVEDPIAGTLTYRKLLMGARILGEKLMPLAPEGKPIGLMLPNANGAAVTLMALMSAGRVPAMINFTAGVTNVLAACRAAKVDTILTSRAFIEKGRLDALIAGLQKEIKIVYLDDIRPTITTMDKLRGFWNCKKPLVTRKPDDWAAILFTSGSEGTPKGVVLSHRNMLANAAQAAARIDFGRQDKVFNVLPVFHSFGLTVGLVLPLVSGVRIYLYPSPLHYRIVPELVYGVNATILFGTDTFLNGYARSAHAYDFRSLRYILAGAEPVKESTRRVYLEKFGLRILEGYGVTETAPALALNTPMFNKFGTVGRLLPGMQARLDKVEGVDEGGRLFVKGPNVMAGYLRTENPGVLEPPPDGWHDTGDIVTIDAQGFITIKGRAKRFAKIAGEMISFAAVEALAGELWPDALSAVASVPDARKGERLILVTQKKDPTRSEFQAFARSRGATEIMVPAEIVYMEKMPLLGTGKIDNMAVTKLVKERFAATPAAAAAARRLPHCRSLATFRHDRTEARHERQRQAVIDLQARSRPSRSVAGAQDALRAGDQDRRRLRPDVPVGGDRVAALPQPSASGSRARPSAFDRAADQECDGRDQVDPRQPGRDLARRHQGDEISHRLPRGRRHAQDHGGLFRRLAAGQHHGVHQPAFVARRADRARHDRGAAEVGGEVALRPLLKALRPGVSKHGPHGATHAFETAATSPAMTRIARSAELPRSTPPPGPAASSSPSSRPAPWSASAPLRSRSPAPSSRPRPARIWWCSMLSVRSQRCCPIVSAMK